MSNVIQIKNGASAPSNSQLANYELGYVRGGSLYINNGGSIVELAKPNAWGLLNNNYLKLPTITNANADTDKFLVCDSSGLVKFRTGANILSDIGALSTSGGTISGNLAVTGSVSGTLIVKSGNWGTSAPTGTGTNGQLYFVLV